MEPSQIQSTIQQQFQEGLALKEKGQHILALKKFDDLQQFVKISGGGDIDSDAPLSIE